MPNVGTSILYAQKENVSENSPPTQAVNSKYQVLTKHLALTDISLTFISSFLPSNFHFAQTIAQMIGNARIFLKDATGQQIIDKYQGKGFGKKAFSWIINFLDNHSKYGQAACYYLKTRNANESLV